MTYEKLDKIAIEIVNLLAEKELSIADIDHVFSSAIQIIQTETKVKKIEC